MYPPNGSPTGNDANGFLSAVFKGQFTLGTASNVQFSLGADDDAFFYVDGKLVNSIGGVHADTPAPVTTSVLSPGVHTITLFYDDRQPSNAALNFDVTSTGIVVTPSVPEPATYWLLLAGCSAAIVGLWRRRPH
jgi:fibro-slime domain-containing protein